MNKLIILSIATFLTSCSNNGITSQAVDLSASIEVEDQVYNGYVFSEQKVKTKFGINHRINF